MLILAIDTSDEIGVIALGKDSQLLCEHHFHCRMSLLRRLLPNVERILDDVGHKIGDLDGIAVSIGPGSFTGLRIGVTTAKSLAYTLGKPIVAVGTLDAIACGCGPTAIRHAELDSAPTADLVCPMIHARAGEVYWALFDSTGEVSLEDPVVGPLSDAFDAISARESNAFFCGSGAVRNSEAIRHKFGVNALVGKSWTAFARGAAVLAIGAQRLRDGLADDPMTLTPLYIRKPTPVVRLETGEFEHFPPSSEVHPELVKGEDRGGGDAQSK